MKLTNKYANSRYSKMNEYYCEITTELDKLTGLDPNGTLGSIEYDENKIITKIHVCTDYVVKTFPNDVNEQLQKFIGQEIEIGE